MGKKSVLKFLWAAFAAALVNAQVTVPSVIPLWSGPAPGALGSAPADSVYVWPYPAAQAGNTGIGIVVCAGGAYDHLAIDKEGHDPAKWFQARGISAFVLKYRLGSSGYHYPIEIDDGKRAVRWLRKNAARYGVRTDHIGMLGFSAGGHLSSAVSTHFDAGDAASSDSVERQSCRPDFTLLVYPVITMDSALTNSGTRLNLIGANPSADLVALMSNEKHITAQTPPAYLASGLNDGLYKNSIMYRDSCKAHGIAAELHLYPDGPHGFGLADGKDGAPTIPLAATWPDSAVIWLKAQGLFKPASLSPFAAQGPQSSAPGSGSRAGSAVLRKDGNALFATPLFRDERDGLRDVLGTLRRD